MSELDFWKVVQEYIVSLESGHTEVKLSREAIRYYQLADFEALPFNILIENGSLFVSSVRLSSTGLKVGDQILTINGKSTSEIIDSLRKLVSRDGENYQYADYRIETEYFKWLYWCLYGGRPNYALEILRNDVSVKITVKSIKSSYPLSEGQTAFKRVAIFPDSIAKTALVRLSTFNYTDYEAFSDTLFSSISKRKIKYLILDLRGNRGGLFNAPVELLRYLIEGPFTFSKSNYSRVTMPSFRVNITDSVLLRRQHFEDVGNGYYSINDKACGIIYPYTRHHYNGALFILTDGGTFSSSSLFVAALIAKREVKMIGQMPGGSLFGCDGGVISTVILPNTHLQLRFPFLWYTNAAEKKISGKVISPEHLDELQLSAKTNEEDIFKIKSYIKRLFTTQIN